MDRKQVVTVWVIGILLGMELIGFVLLAYFSTFGYFISRFVQAIRFLSPIFLWLYIVFAFFILVGRGQEFTRASWRDYLVETLHFFLVSFLIAVAAIALCAFTSALIVSLGHWMGQRPCVRFALQALHQWVRAYFY